MSCTLPAVFLRMHHCLSDAGQIGALTRVASHPEFVDIQVIYELPKTFSPFLYLPCVFVMAGYSGQARYMAPLEKRLARLWHEGSISKIFIALSLAKSWGVVVVGILRLLENYLNTN